MTSFFKEIGLACRGKLGIVFRQAPTTLVIKSLMNVLGHEYTSNGWMFKFYCCPTGHVSDIKIVLAKQALHRIGFERFNEVFTENPDELFGIDLN